MSKEMSSMIGVAMMFSIAIGGLWVAIEQKVTVRNIAGSIGAGFGLTLMASTESSGKQ